MSYKEEFIRFMLDNGVLRFGDFITKSGRKTPYFINSGEYKSGSAISKLGDFYAKCIVENGLEPEILYGPAYKGIPLVTSTAASLYEEYGKDIPFSFNRKETKDHGEGGVIIGTLPKDGDVITIIEDVITAGTSVRESIELLTSLADVKPENLVIAVDRMEVGPDGKSAIEEIKEEYGITTYPIVTIRDILDTLYGVEIDGKVVIDDTMREKIETYLAENGV